MRKILLSMAALVVASSINAQIVNGDLENWSAGNPSDWMFDGKAGTNNIHVVGTTEVTGSNASGGAGSSALLETKITSANTVPALLLGEWSFSGEPKNIHFDYVAKPLGNDTCLFEAILLDANDKLVGGAVITFAADKATTQWNRVYVPVTYLTAEPAVKMRVRVLSSFSMINSAANMSEGSKFYVDNVFFKSDRIKLKFPSNFLLISS